MTGSVVATKWAQKGDEFTVRMDGLGLASVKFS